MEVIRRWRVRITSSLTKLAPSLLLACGLLVSPVNAEDVELSYDLYSRESRLTVWVDLSPCVDAAVVSRLEDGIDVLLDCQVSLSIPRRFFGDRPVAREADTRRLSFRGVTEEYIVTDVLDPDGGSLSYPSLASLYQHFQDSIEIDLISLDSLESQNRYVLTLNVTTISLTDLNLAPTEEPSEDGESPLRFLFRQFLSLTEYGRNEYTTKSRPFSLNEVEPEL